METGDSFKLGRAAVFFRSQAGVRVDVGCRSLVQQSKLADGAKVPDFTVMVGNEVVGKVEWGACPDRDDDDSDSRRDGDDSDD